MNMSHELGLQPCLLIQLRTSYFHCSMLPL
uniref:Uncharacterized protein n=1 Tax=Arundo donax TaxID=35708 RepID=A0A0A8ZFZ8_ARUDO